MKKFLSLVLALVMTMSLVTVSAGAKDFTDSSKINYAEAVDVLSEVRGRRRLCRRRLQSQQHPDPWRCCQDHLQPDPWPHRRIRAACADAAPYKDVACQPTPSPATSLTAPEERHHLRLC